MWRVSSIRVTVYRTVVRPIFAQALKTREEESPILSISPPDRSAVLVPLEFGFAAVKKFRASRLSFRR